MDKIFIPKLLGLTPQEVQVKMDALKRLYPSFFSYPGKIKSIVYYTTTTGNTYTGVYIDIQKNILCGYDGTREYFIQTLPEGKIIELSKLK